jgi:hypothetical protein
MATLAFSSVGSTVSLSVAAPATETGSGYAALTYTPIAELTDIGMVGPEKSVILHNPVSENVTYKLPGGRNNGAMDLKGARAPSDPGQAMLITAEAGTGPVSVCVELQEGTKIYFQGLVLSYKTSIGGQSQITAFESKLEVSGGIVTVAAA